MRCLSGSASTSGAADGSSTAQSAAASGRRAATSRLRAASRSAWASNDRTSTLRSTSGVIRCRALLRLGDRLAVVVPDLDRRDAERLDLRADLPQITDDDPDEALRMNEILGGRLQVGERQRLVTLRQRRREVERAPVSRRSDEA